MAPDLLLGIDLGSSAVKAVLLDRAGQEVARSRGEGPFRRHATGEVEASVADLLDTAARSLSELSDLRRRVAAVGIAGMSESGAPLDDSGRPLAPVIAWHDPRGGEVADRIEERFGPELARSIGQRLRAVSTVAKLGWLIEHELGSDHRRVARWLGVPELVLHALTGEEATEWSLAARTGCFAVDRRDWLPDVAAAAGFDLGVFPAVRAAGTEMGAMSSEGEAWSGVPRGVPVTVAGHDHLVGAAGSGAGFDDLVNSVGTAETVVARTATLPEVESALSRRLAITLLPGGEGWAVLASAARAGVALEAAAARLERSPAELDRLAAEAGPGGGTAEEALPGPAGPGGGAAEEALPGPAGPGGGAAEEALPGPAVLDAPGLLESLRRRDPPALPEGPPGAVWRTLLDALAQCTAEAVDRLTEVASVPVAAPATARRMVVFGGGAASGPWNEARVARLRMPVWRTSAQEAVARGAAVYAGMAVGWWTSPEAAPRPQLHPLAAPQERK